jgi:hypothetical protein
MNSPLGRKAKFRFSRIPAISGTIRYVPSIPGECWIVECDDGIEAYVQQFDAMFLYPEKLEQEARDD